jgi:hypothetical protein
MKPPAEQFLADAILSLSPTTTEFTIDGDKYSDINFISECALTKKQIEDEAKRLEEEWTANEYARNRADAYPSIGDQLDMQYHDQLNGTTTWKDAVAKVKADNPKGG